MKYIIAAAVLSLQCTANACTGYVVGYKGMHDLFDKDAYNTYVASTSYCSKVYSHWQVAESEKFIKTLKVPYQLYGYSAGARAISDVMPLLRKHNSAMPELILTFGAYKTAKVNFTEYKVPFKNFFDGSGIGQTSPGVYLKVPHSKIQAEANLHLLSK